MKDKVYVVLAEWESQSGDFDSCILGLFYDMRQAVECLKTERDTILSETYNTSFGKCEGVNITGKGENHIFISSEFGYRWDSLTICEKEIEQRDFIAIQFEYDGETFNERIYLDQIDREHYDDHWDWWFGPHEGSKHPDLNFEVFGDRDGDGNIICDAFEINVYENEDAMDSIATICDFKLTQSWLSKKAGCIDKIEAFIENKSDL